jgi:hypothetical protein
MRCSKAVQLLQLYIDRQLPLSSLHALETHIATCPTCAQELRLLEEVADTLNNTALVMEPTNLTSTIMQRVAISSLQKDAQRYQLFRPSSSEMMLVLVLATVTMLFVIAAQPNLRDSLPLTDGLATLALLLTSMLHLFVTWGSFGLWIAGTLLGVCITIATAGNEMRSLWLKAMTDRLPVW